MVSIIVPVYNASSYIEKTIEMVCSQTYKDWELILVDDASRDNSAQIIEDYIKKQGKRIRLIRKKTNQGAAEARNTGIDASSGRFIAFLDADDCFLAITVAVLRVAGTCTAGTAWVGHGECEVAVAIATPAPIEVEHALTVIAVDDEGMAAAGRLAAIQDRA